MLYMGGSSLIGGLLSFPLIFLTTKHSLMFEFSQIIDNLASEECDPILQRRLINDNCGTLGFDPFHDPLNGTLAEVV